MVSIPAYIVTSNCLVTEVDKTYQIAHDEG
jgi:hypothetical protein